MGTIIKEFCINLEQTFVIGSIVVSVFICFVNYRYSMACEKLYNIPSEYFSLNVIKILFDTIKLIVYELILFWSLSSNAQYDSKIIEIIMSFIAVFFMIFIPILLCWNIIKCLIIGIIVAIIIVIIKYYCKNIYNFIIVLCMPCCCITIIINIFKFNLKTKWEYEVVVIKNKNYIVLSHYNNYLVCIDYKSDTKGKLNLLTNDYYLIVNDFIRIRRNSFKQNGQFKLGINGIFY